MGRRLAVDERRNRQRCRFQAKLTPLLYGVATDGDQCPRCFCLRFSFRCSKRASASSVRHESIRTLAKPPTRFVTHGKATRDYSLSLAMTKTCNLGFTNDAQVTPVDSLAIAAGGLQWSAESLRSPWSSHRPSPNTLGARRQTACTEATLHDKKAWRRRARATPCSRPSCPARIPATQNRCLSAQRSA